MPRSAAHALQRPPRERLRVGGEQTLPQSLRCIRPGGTLSMIGVLSGGSLTGQLGRVPEHAAEILGWYRGFADVQDAARVVSLDEIKAKDWTLYWMYLYIV